jgi:hypothetical protein
MVRTISTLALSLLLLTDANAQSRPAVSNKKAAIQADRAAKRAAKKAERVAAKETVASKKSAAVDSEGWPIIDESAVASAATDATYDAAPETSPYGRANVYAAPGMPVNIRTSNVRVPYSVRADRKPAQPKTTLSNGQ